MDLDEVEGRGVAALRHDQDVTAKLARVARLMLAADELPVQRFAQREGRSERL